MENKSQLSLDHFHTGQDIVGNDKEKALHYLKLSVEDIRGGTIDDKIVGEDWKNYIKATIAYMENDLTKLEEISSSVTNQERKAIITRFIAGLKKRGKPDYNKDY